MSMRYDWLILLAIALYVISPLDLFPGPVDDAILCVLYVLNARDRIMGAHDDTPEIDKG